MQIQIHQNKCILCGVCEAVFPQVFKQTVVIEVNMDEAIKDPGRVLTCEAMCPLEAIEVGL